MRKLVFNFYITKDWRENIVYTIHFNCLNYYKDCFDEVYFAMSCEDPSDIDSINEVEYKLLKIFGTKKKVIFDLVENDPIYCEVPTFKREIIDKLGEDNLVFFGHLKGVMDIKLVDMYNEDPEDIYRRICGLYYFSLEGERKEKEVTRSLMKDVCAISYGAFMTQFTCEHKLKNVNAWYYAGTFFWINSRRLKDYIEDNNIKLPSYRDRFYAENFLGDIYPIFALVTEIGKSDMLAASYRSRYIYNGAPNKIDFNGQIKFLIEGQEEQFNDFVQEMKKV